MSQNKKQQTNVDLVNDENGDIETELSIPADWNLTNEDRYVYAFHNTESPKLKVNQLSIYGIEFFEKDGGYEATGLIRSTAQQEIQLNLTTIFLLDSDKEVIGKKEFDLSGLGTLPTNSSRPWKFNFSQKDLNKKIKLPLESWSLAFEIKAKHQLNLEESWEKTIADDTKQSLQNIMETAEPLKPGEVNFMGISIKQHDNGELAVTVLIRNGAEKNISFEKIPLAVKDATGKEVARGSFTLDDFSVKANTSKPWTFIFPASMVLEEEPDLTKWQAYVIN